MLETSGLSRHERLGESSWQRAGLWGGIRTNKGRQGCWSLQPPPATCTLLPTPQLCCCTSRLCCSTCCQLPAHPVMPLHAEPNHKFLFQAFRSKCNSETKGRALLRFSFCCDLPVPGRRRKVPSTTDLAPSHPHPCRPPCCPCKMMGGGLGCERHRQGRDVGQGFAFTSFPMQAASLSELTPWAVLQSLEKKSSPRSSAVLSQLALRNMLLNWSLTTT